MLEFILVLIALFVGVCATITLPALGFALIVIAIIYVPFHIYIKRYNAKHIKGAEQILEEARQNKDNKGL